MPESLKQHIAGLKEAHRNQIWVTCYGENGADREILGDIEYYPTQGFPSYFYPYVNTGGYLSPLVAVKFTRPKRKFFHTKILTVSSLKYELNLEIRKYLAESEAENFSKNLFISHLTFFSFLPFYLNLRCPSANQIINIECRAWAKNINYVGSHRDRQVSE
jgi:hypothetical protein